MGSLLLLLFCYVVDVKHFSDKISLALSQLKEGEFTKPLSYGEHYVIFKRLKLNN